MSEKIIERTPQEVHDNIVKLLQENKQLKQDTEKQVEINVALNNIVSEKQTIINKAIEYTRYMFNNEPCNSREYDYRCEKLLEILGEEEDVDYE